MQFRTKPFIISAIQFDGTPKGAVEVFSTFDIPGAKFVPGDDLGTGALTIPSTEGDYWVEAGSFIVKTEIASYVPYSLEQFAERFETVNGSPLLLNKCQSCQCSYLSERNTAKFCSERCRSRDGMRRRRRQALA